MRILLISFNDITDTKYGGGQCSRRNFEFLKKYGTVDVICIRKKNNLESAKAILSGNFPPLAEKEKKEIFRRIANEKYSFVFLDSSLLGNIGKGIKERDSAIAIVVFFHNIEYDYIDVHIKAGIKNCIYKYLARRQEEHATACADKIIVLNNRDNNRLRQLYHRGADAILPISFDDKFDESRENIRSESGKPIALFVGAFGRSNYEGIRWFVRGTKLLDKIDLKIVGKGFEVVKDELEAYGCKVAGTVNDIAKCYETASFVVAPILFGGGMKVKIAEALMYGKTVFGTSEALEGYEDDDGSSLYLCSSIEDFDNRILNWIRCDGRSFNRGSRKLFAEKYDSKVVEDQFNQLIKSL